MSDSIDLKGVVIHSIDEIKRFDSGFYCVNFVVKIEDAEYPQFLSLQMNKEKADNLVKFNKVGDKVDVSINLRGRLWTNKENKEVCFNTLEAWKVFKADGSADKEAEAKDDLDLPF